MPSRNNLKRTRPLPHGFYVIYISIKNKYITSLRTTYQVFHLFLHLYKNLASED